ncbi:MAG TPA: hypothetical protein VFP52_10055 [Myxococcales bacterium]|nr:hypothetical protein [Myxococcales bacterium]
MKRLALLFPAALLACATTGAASADRGGAGTSAPSSAAAQLRDDMRKLWEDHVTYTAFFYKAAINGSDDAGKIAERLLRNQDDIGNAVKPFYGDAAGNKVASLLRDHILIAADVVKAAKAGDSAALDQANKKWYQNADDLAATLASVNPNWPQKTLQDALHTHLQMVTDQVVATLHHDAAAAIAAYDKGAEHMLMVADVLSSGIVKQFPDRFRS